MGLFSKILSIFNKSISVMPYQKGEVVSFAKTKKGMLKIGNELNVDENYVLVITHYNKICDILHPGTYKVEDINLPKLFKYSKMIYTRRGLFSPKTIKADCYFVNMNEFKHMLFKTPERIVCFNNDKKVKLHLEGSFTLKVVHAERLMKAFCDDYAVVKNKYVVKDICTTIGFEVSKILNKRNFSLADFMSNHTKIVEAISQEINKRIEKYGLTATEFFITNVLLPKRYSSEIKKDNSQDEEIVKIVEERLNDLKKDLDVVYVDRSGNSSLNNSNENTNLNEYSNQNKSNNDLKEVHVNNSSSQSYNNQSNINQQNPYNTLKTDYSNVNFNTNSNYNNFNSYNVNANNVGYNVNNANLQSNEKQGNQNFTNSANNFGSNYNTIPQQPFIISSAPQPMPNIIEEVKVEKTQKEDVKPVRKKSDSEIDENIIIEKAVKEMQKGRSQKEQRIFDIIKNAKMVKGTAKSEQVITPSKKMVKCKGCFKMIEEDSKFCSYCGKSTEELIVCPCCGAKNFPKAKVCCVCKSSLD